MNVEMLLKEEGTLKTPNNVAPRNAALGNGEDDPSVDAYISKLHLTNLEKQHASWKPYNRNCHHGSFLR